MRWSAGVATMPLLGQRVHFAGPIMVRVVTAAWVPAISAEAEDSRSRECPRLRSPASNLKLSPSAVPGSDLNHSARIG